ERMGCVMILANSAQDQPGTGVFEKEPDGSHNQQADIDHQVMLKHDWSEDGDLCQKRDVNIGNLGRFDPDVTLTDQGREPEPEKRKTKPGGDLVGEQKLRQQSECEREHRPTGSGG